MSERCIFHIISSNYHSPVLPKMNILINFSTFPAFVQLYSGNRIGLLDNPLCYIEIVVREYALTANNLSPGCISYSI